MLRETTFRLGGALTIALGGTFAVALYLAGAGWAFFDAWLGAGICVGFGVFFLYVAGDEGRTHREELRSLEATGTSPPGPRPP
jgi:hypothetical protein